MAHLWDGRSARRWKAWAKRKKLRKRKKRLSKILGNSSSSSTSRSRRRRCTSNEGSQKKRAKHSNWNKNRCGTEIEKNRLLPFRTFVAISWFIRNPSLLILLFCCSMDSIRPDRLYYICDQLLFISTTVNSTVKNAHNVFLFMTPFYIYISRHVNTVTVLCLMWRLSYDMLQDSIKVIGHLDAHTICFLWEKLHRNEMGYA